MHPTYSLASSVALVPLALALPPSASAQELVWRQSPVTGRWYAEATAPSSWSGGRARALAFGADLVAVGSAAESAWLDAEFLGAISLHRFHWIGLFQDHADPGYSEPAGGWTWSSGEPLAFTNWAPGQPDDVGGQDFGRSSGPASPFPAQWADESEHGFGTADNDWYVGPGQVVLVDTANSTIAISAITFVPGTDDVANAVPSGQQPVIGGVVDVDDVYIDASAAVRVQGPNPFTLIASGRVVIRGTLDASGQHNHGVVTLNTTSIPEPGSPGHAGGGRGGTGSPLTNASSPFGGNGSGAWNVPDLGGQGGESGWSHGGNVNNRRGAGGGGGVLGRDVAFPGGPLLEQRRIGFDAEDGFDNLAGDFGAVSGAPGPFGGARGPSPFTDGDPANDFFGLRVDDVTGAIRLGELVRPWAGAGGGAGGDASQVPPGTSWPGPWNPSGDEKGSGGAGGGGSVHVLALEHIAFGPAGQIKCRGGIGGGGENTIFLDRVGGGSGGGSGGHVVLESARYVDFRAKAGVNWSNQLDNAWAIDVRGGQGGAGQNDLGGGQNSVNGQKETIPTQDACPPGYPTTGANACRGQVHGAGGDGGPGIVQLHTPSGRYGTTLASGADILLPQGVPIDRICASVPLFSDNTPNNPTAHALASAGRGLALYEVASADCDADLIPDTYEIALEPSLDLDGDGALDACEPAVAYCTAGTTSSGCVPAIGSFGTPSASAGSGFAIVANAVEGQRNGMLYYGLAPHASPWAPGSTSTLCVAPPVQRLGVQSSGGFAGQCNGQLALDWNAWRSAHPGALGSPFAAGETYFAQAWFRDASNPRGNLSNALQYTLEP
jgi:hypothetical protein